MGGISGDKDPVGIFFWGRSGAGHRTAKEGIKQQKIKEYEADGKNLDTSRDIDITGEKVLNAVQIPFLGGIGDIWVNAWDGAQRRGDLKWLETFAHLGWIGEIIFYPLVYFKVKWMLQELTVEPEFIVSTQAFCLNAIVRAMQTVNKEKKWNMHMHVYLTDLPSKKAIHFFPSISKVTAHKDLRSMLTLHAPPPLIKENQTEEDEAHFWRKYCGKVDVITKEKFPIREAFLETSELKERLEKPTVNVKLKLNHAQETEIIKTGLSATALTNSIIDSTHVTLNVHNDDKLAFLMLGSQPTTQSVMRWLSTFVSSSKKAPVSETDGKQHYFFLYCGAPHAEEAPNPLLETVHKELDSLKAAGKLPPHFSVIPFTNQDAGEIALLMARSDVSITRSGGATSMELLQLHDADLPKRAGKLTLIHSEAMESQDAFHLLYDTSEFVNKIRANVMRQIERQTLLNSAEWVGIKEEMVEFCEQMGYSKGKSRRIVDNVLRLYAYNDGSKEKPDLEEIFLSLQEHAKRVSKIVNEQEEKIEAKMEMMRQKDKYQSCDLAALKQLAIENILTKKGIALWEAGNAKYLRKKIGAHIVNPGYAKNLLDRSFFEIS